MSYLKMKSRSLLLLIGFSTLVVLFLGACAASVKTLPSSDKILKIEEYFAGNSKAYGILFDRSGAPQRNFSVDLVGTWDEAAKTLTLKEDFVFDDGEKSQRIWVIRKTGQDQYVGKADDVIGEATGSSKGNAFHWNYVLEVPYKGSTIALNIDDWLYLSDDDVLINRAEMFKFGFKVGEIVISFSKQ